MKVDSWFHLPKYDSFLTWNEPKKFIVQFNNNNKNALKSNQMKNRLFGSLFLLCACISLHVSLFALEATSRDSLVA